MSTDVSICFFCDKPCVMREGDNDSALVECRSCGRYSITKELEFHFDDRAAYLTRQNRRRLGGVAREYTDARQPLVFTTDTTMDLLLQAPIAFDVPAKIRKLIRDIARRSLFAGDYVGYHRDKDWTVGYADNREEFIYQIEYAQELKWIETSAVSCYEPSSEQNDITIALTPLGWEELEKSHRVDSKRVFTAMSFDKSLDTVWKDGIYPAIESCGFTPMRIDEEEFTEGIVDKIIAEINESRFVVADLTLHRNGVYFEAGYAKGLGLPVIWICREDELKNSHFDVKHFNIIVWQDVDNLRERLSTRIRAVIGKA
ncbi:hypothetical protein [Bythopirellula goksoeyrii]|uniref:Nucleoside 2-deoxyribosyltransferase n=1 Tax=Bythopirellula goksoeyrii TaxID=1400387 RepID=A0A5B9QM97_9BACT|nr:hypothetical protein [Bythopirellula goksoeyrii]QEG35241.1 hypothetical protein Pr1d_25350 [Bythopirellula goksoeyrii]